MPPRSPAWWRTGRVAALLCVLCTVSGPVIKAQTKHVSDYEIRRNSIQDGMASQVITALCTDAAGILWIGTIYGLYTFDGFRVASFDNLNPSDKQWSKLNVSNLVADTAGGNLIFAGTRDGVWAINPVTRRFVSDTALGLPAGFLKTCVYIEKSAGGFYWLLRRQTLYKLVKTAANRYACRPAYQLPACTAPSIQADPTDSEGVWVLPAKAVVYYLNAKGLRHFDIPENTAMPSPVPGLVRWSYTEKGIIGWDHARNMYRFNAGRGQIEPAGNQYDLYDFFPGMKAVDDYIKQKPQLNLHLPIGAGQQLFGTSLGLFIVRKKLSCFQVIETLRGEEVRGIHTDASGKWWAGTYNGIYAGALKTRQVQHFNTPCVWDFLPLNDRLCLLALEIPRGIAYWDVENNKLIPDAHLLALANGHYDTTSALSLCRDMEGTLWAGTYKRILWAPARPPYRFRYLTDSHGHDLETPFVRTLLADAKRGIWAGSENGLLRIIYNPKQQRYEATRPIPNLEGITISDLFRDRHQRLWIATKGKGIACVDLKNAGHPLRWYNTADGLCNDFTCRIEGSNDDGVLWISTHNGLSRLDLQTGNFHNFYEDSGFPGNEFNSAASAVFPNGALLFGGVSGLISFHPDSVPFADFRYKTILSGAKVYNKETGLLSTLPLYPATGISLPPYPDYIEFQLGSTEYINPVKVRFRYRLHGLSELWTYTSGERDIKFIRLAPGNYVLEVQAIPLDGHFGAPVILPLFVDSPYYETWWFKALLLAFVFGVAYMAYRYRLRQVLQEQRIRRQIADDLHDDIGNKLNMISILTQKIANRFPEPENPVPNTGDLGKLIEVSRNALRSLHTMIWSVDSEKDRLSSLVDRMQDFACDYLLPLNIPFRFDAGVPVLVRDIDLTARHHIILIYQELLTNMVKYTHPVLITIAIQVESGTLRLVLTNNHGQPDGSSYDSVSSQRGLASIERRLNRINGKMTWLELSATQQETTLIVPRIFKHH